MVFKLSNLNSNISLTLGYLNPALNNLALMVKTRVIRLRVIEGPNVHDQILFCTFHTFVVEVQTNAGYIHAMHA